MIEVQLSYLKEPLLLQYEDYEFVCEYWTPSLNFPAIPQPGDSLALEYGAFKIHSIFWVGDQGIGDGKAFPVAQLKLTKPDTDWIKRVHNEHREEWAGKTCARKEVG